MIWENAEIIKIELGAVDRLGNPTKTYRKPQKIKARLTQWTDEDVNLYGRELTKTARKMLTPSTEINQNCIVAIDEKKYKVKNIFDLGRFRLAFIERYNYEI